MLKIFHFHNGKKGGVYSVIKNLIEYSQNYSIENHLIYTINNEELTFFKKNEIKGLKSEQIFIYSPRWNFYHTSRELSKLLPDERAVIIAHDWLELGMVSNIGLKNPLLFILHGDYEYYYQLAEKHSPWIDCFITVSLYIKQQLQFRLKDRVADIKYLRFPVIDVKLKVEKSKKTLNILFAGRCEEAKGYNLLPLIESELKLRNIEVVWHIAGEWSLDITNQQIWPSRSNVTFYGNLEHNQLLELLMLSNICILPSYAEGMPIILAEAMKAGAVPIANKLSSGLQEIIQNGINGYLIPNNEIIEYVKVIEKLYIDFDLLNTLSLNAKLVARNMFDPYQNTLEFESQVQLSSQDIRLKKSTKIYGSRLDQPWLPNSLVEIIRNLLT